MLRLPYAASGSCLQRLFSTFPNGWPGIGILLQRVLTATTLFCCGIAHLRDTSQFAAIVPHLLAAVGGILLLVGLWTPIAGTLVAIVELWIVCSSAGGPPPPPWNSNHVGHLGCHPGNDRTWRVVHWMPHLFGRGSTSKSRNAKRFLITQKGERSSPPKCVAFGLRQIPIRRPSIYGCAQVAGHCTLHLKTQQISPFRRDFGRYRKRVREGLKCMGIPSVVSSGRARFRKNGLWSGEPPPQDFLNELLVTAWLSWRP